VSEFASATASRRSFPSAAEGGCYLPCSSSPHMEIVMLPSTVLEVFFPYKLSYVFFNFLTCKALKIF